MPVTAQQLQSVFPEFASARIPVVTAKIAEAALRCSAGEFGTLQDMAVLYMAAHLIAMSPGGEFARLKFPHLEKDGAATIYERMYNDIRSSAILAVAVA
jgi:membrane-bound ClpP family serine protease